PNSFLNTNFATRRKSPKPAAMIGSFIWSLLIWDEVLSFMPPPRESFPQCSPTRRRLRYEEARPGPTASAAPLSRPPWGYCDGAALAAALGIAVSPLLSM